LVPDPPTAGWRNRDVESRRKELQPPWFVQRLRARDVKSNAAIGQDEDPRAERQGEVEIVRHREAGCSAAGFFAQQAEALQLLIDVEKRGGLVEQEQSWRLRKARREQDALAFATA
jgi:hypothetical protein